MTDHLVTPDREITIGETSFTLRGSFEALRAVQHGFAQDVMLVQARVIDMRVDEVARLIALASGAKEEGVGQLLLDEVDVTSTDYLILKAELMSWLAIAMTPKRDREKKARAMAELLEGLRNPASRGGSTGSSASASSAGPRRRSGKAPSGT